MGAVSVVAVDPLRGLVADIGSLGIGHSPELFQCGSLHTLNLAVQVR